ncbi:MAG: PKD domain-containing protein [Candidatus Heimdallarchaeota archaeon]|nr:PKD domain-containing protein [Candidatus Heimdallarchaeota archaeon]
MVTKTQQRGTAGALFVISLLLGTMVYLNLDTVGNLGEIDVDAIYVDNDLVYVGEEVRFKLHPTILSVEYGIQFFVWDFHDGSYIEYSTRNDSSVPHTFYYPGEFLVSVLAMQTNETSRIFTIPITVVNEPQDIKAEASKTEFYEDEIITFSASRTGNQTEILNYMWEWGDSYNDFGELINHSYAQAGEYTIRLKGYTNESHMYTTYLDVTVLNKEPIAAIDMSSNIVNEDVIITFTGGVSDSSSDLDSMRYVWSFGDGLMEEGRVVEHYYTLDGNYTVTLTTIDNDGARNNATAIVEIMNKAPTIHSIWNSRSVYVEGETVTSFANFVESDSDLTFLDFDWGVPGMGRELSRPYYDNGTYNVELTITDDDGASDYYSTDNIHLVNNRPYVSLLSGITNEFSIEFTMWGTMNSKANITLYASGEKIESFNITNLDELRNTSRVLYRIDGLQQPLEEYWDILILMNDTIDHTTFVGVNFILDNGEIVHTVNECATESGACVDDTYRFPIAPLDRGFPTTYNFSVFDPGNDDLTVFLDLGSNSYNVSFAAPEYGPSTGIVTITGFLPFGETTDTIYYWAEDEDGATSDIYQFPILDYLKLPKPAEYQDKSTWGYWGHLIEYYAPVAFFNNKNTYNINQPTTFMLYPNHPNPAILEYKWHFGNGNTTLERYPTFSYEYAGKYLLWIVIFDNYYEHVEFMELTLNAPMPLYSTVVRGVQLAGEELVFEVTKVLGDEDFDDLRFYWDFGDGTAGYGTRCNHAYTQNGNYTFTLRVVDQYNVIDYTENIIGIFNGPPVAEAMSETVDVIEGNIVSILPYIKDSPFDLLGLEYQWDIDGTSHNTHSIWLKSDRVILTNLVVYDRSGANYTFDFRLNITSVPVEISIPRHFLYGNPTGNLVTIGGSISPGVFEQFSKIDEYAIDFTLYDKNGIIIDTGFGMFYPDSFSFKFEVNTSMIGTDMQFDSLKETLTIMESLNTVELPSGEYRVSMRLLDNNTSDIVSTKSTSLIVTIDKDGDLITDELETLMDNVTEEDYSILSADTNGDGNADPVEYLLKNDHDGDGLPVFLEEYYGTSDNNTDSDGDMLTDGFGAFGELQIGSNPASEDTDNDGLLDGEEVFGWQIYLVTPDGLEIREVHSSPLKEDTDNDGVTDYYEFSLKIDPSKADTDDDGLDDLMEQNYGTSLLNADSDGDGLSDYDETTIAYTCDYLDDKGQKSTKTFYLSPLANDSDEDGISDFDEVFTYHSVGTNRDSDSDGINDSAEIHIYHTNIISADSDGDGLVDGLEIKGFDIPVVQIGDAKYAEDGTILVKPTAYNYTVRAYTNPNNWDTDGDGLSDYEELMGDTENVSNPASADSDGDGILDQFDPQKLISDYTPASIQGGISVRYESVASETVRRIGDTLIAGLDMVWNIMKNIASWFWNLIESYFYWKEVCVLGICADWPVLHSWSTIVRKTQEAFTRFAQENIFEIYAEYATFNQFYESTWQISGFGLDVKTFAGIPYDIDVTGSISVVGEEREPSVEGFFDPKINMRMNIRDQAGISHIKVIQDGVLKKTIRNINQGDYYFNEYFTISQEMWDRGTTELTVEIVDIGGNIRVISRELEVSDEAVWEDFWETVLSVVEDIWDWTVAVLEEIGDVVMDVIEAVIDFVNTTYWVVVDFIGAVFDMIWEGFVEDTINFLTRDTVYGQRADAGFDILTDAYVQERSNAVVQMDIALSTGPFAEINNTINDISDLADKYMPSLEPARALIEPVLGPILDFFEGSVIQLAFEFLAGKALEIVNDLIYRTLERILKNTIWPYVQAIEQMAEDLFADFQALAPDLGPLDFSSEDGDLLDMLFAILEFLRNPFAILADALSNINGENIMNIMDNFFIDNAEYLLSMNDIIRTILKPGLILGLIVSDIVTMVEDIFSFNSIYLNSMEQFIFQIEDIAVYESSITMNGVSRVLDEKNNKLSPDWEASDTAELISNIVSLIMGGLQIALDVWQQISDLKDFDDGDREAENILKFTLLNWVLLAFSDGQQIIVSLFTGVIGADNTTEADKDLDEWIQAVATVGVDFFSGMFLLMPTIWAARTQDETTKNVLEKICTFIDIVRGALIGIMDIAWTAVNLKKYWSISTDWERAHTILGMIATFIQGAIDTVFQFLLMFGYTDWAGEKGPVIYHAVMTVNRVVSLVMLILDLIATIIDAVSMPGYYRHI